MSGSLWRRRYLTAVVLLRAVGHVLDRVDAREDEGLRGRVNRHYLALQNYRDRHAIYWEFIKKERDLFVKQYESAARRTFYYGTPGERFEYTGSDGTKIQGVRMERTTITYTLVKGLHAGRDVRDVIQEAIDWWKKSLDEIELC